ncbi:TPR-like protein [Mycena metata]|uniref:TPR-like protein n=1 Tax=Mycena metata TaxID=1033252 RepID=A0AAD7JZ86_9AGAR|nr:TPR-like protein [Mycena metata]
MADLQTTAQKVATAKEKKEIADKAFKEGKITEALMAYHGSLMYLLGLDKNALQGLGMGSPAPPPEASSSSSSTSAADAKEKEKTERRYTRNMSACHLKNKNWKRAQETADKALAKNDKNYKAMFRKAKALSEQGYFERAVKLLEDLKSKSPADAALADAELTRLRALDKERERANNKRLKGFLNKAAAQKPDQEEEVIEAIQSAKIEEVLDDEPVASTSSA